MFTLLTERQILVLKAIVEEFIHTAQPVGSRVLSKKEELLNEARVDLLNKQIERKSLEKLKENKFNLHKKKEELKEQATNDEFGMYSFLRHKSENA